MAKAFDDDFEDGNGIDDEAVMKDAGERITKTLGEVLYQTSKHLCINTGLSIGTVIDWIDGNGDQVYGEQVGNIWVYYLPENHPARLAKPIKLYFGGSSGRTICTRPALDRGNTGNLKVGQKLILNLPKPAVEEKKSFSRNLPEMDLEEVERLAAIDPDTVGIAEELDVNPARFRHDLNHNIGLKKAYEKGKKIYMDNKSKENKKTAAVKPPATVAAKTGDVPHSSSNRSRSHVPLHKRLTPAIVEQAAANGETTVQLGIRLGVGGKHPGKQIEAFVCSSKYPELQAAWKRGKAMKTAASSETKSVATDFVIPEKKPEVKEPIALPQSNSAVAVVDREETDEEFAERRLAERTLNGEDVSLPDPGESPSDDIEQYLPEAANGEPLPLEENQPAKHRHFANCQGCDLPFQGFPNHVGADGALCQKCEARPPDEPISDTGALETRREKIEEIQSKLIPSERRSFSHEVHLIGAFAKRPPQGLSMNFNGDFFELSPNQRNILCAMAALNDEFKQEEN